MCTVNQTSKLPIFGIALKVLCERSSVDVPPILADVLRWLAAHALAVGGIFAEPARTPANSQLKCAVDAGVPVTDVLNGANPALVASFLKRWLEELPNPILDWDQQVELLSSCKDESSIHARIAALNEASVLIDHISLATLKPLLLFLQQYCFRQRRFDLALLQVAIAFAPILFPAALAAGPGELRLAEETVATLVSNALHIFNPALAANVPVVTPQALCEAAAAAEMASAASSSAPQQRPQQQLSAARPQAHLHAHAQALAGVARPTSTVVVIPSRRPQPSSPAKSATTSNAAAPAAPPASPTRPHHPPHPQHHQHQHHPQQPVVYEHDEEPYEPYLSDAPFLTAFSAMVADCVTAELFSDARDCDDAHFEQQQQHQQHSPCHSHCGLQVEASSEDASCASPMTLSSGANSGYFSYDSATSNTLLRDNALFLRGPCAGGPAAPMAASPWAVPAAADALPYSPRAEPVPWPVEEGHAAGAPREQAWQDGSPCGQPPLVLSIGMDVDVQDPSACELGGEVSEGNVVCIISADGGGTAGKGGRKPALGAAGRAAEFLMEQAALEQSVVRAPYAHPTCRRPTEGGAAADEAGEMMAAAAAAAAAAATAAICGSINGPSGAGALYKVGGRRSSGGGGADGADAGSVARQRRMSMGGSGGGGAAPSGPRSTSTTAPYRLQLSPSRSAGGAPPAQHRRMSMGGSGGGGRDRRSSSGGSLGSPRSSGGGAPPSAQPIIEEGLPPTDGSSSSRLLGVAGHLLIAASHHEGDVDSTPNPDPAAAATAPALYTLSVQELSTPSACAHLLPLQSMGPAALQLEKDLLKRQLKQVAAAYMSLAGSALTPALKEPLRPVYARYHRLRALLGDGASSGGSGAQ